MDGWNIQHHGGVWTAVRHEELTVLQREYGCEPMVSAHSRGELDVRVTAENIKHAIVSAAERLVAGMLEAERRRAEDASRG